ncbi:MAG: glycoside hydrolase family 140 protein [Sedimentisphaerales bacterium]
MTLILALSNPLHAEKPWDHGNLKISLNRHFLIHEDDTPFFMLADTAWEVLLRGAENEVMQYLDLRQAQGFNTILTTVHGDDVIPEWNSPNRQGRRPHLPSDTNGDPTRLNEPFWKNVDWFILQCEKRGIYVGLFPTWTRFWCSTDDTGRVKAITKENAYAYGKAVGSRYADTPNLLWFLGGDTRPSMGDGLPMLRNMAKGIKDGETESGGFHHLISYHRNFEWVLDDTPESWLDFWGPGVMNVNTLLYKRMWEDWNRKPTKPLIDIESSYEGPPPGGRGLYISDKYIRLFCYWKVFAGSCGITYGAGPVWGWSIKSLYDSWYPHQYWEQGLAYPGATQVRHIRMLMLSRPFTSRVPDQQVVLNNFPQGEEKKPNLRYMMATRGEGYLMVYTHYGDAIEVKLGPNVLSGTEIKAWWFNPTKGGSTFIGRYENRGSRTFDPPGEPARGNDWVLVVDDASKGWQAPAAERK